MLVATCQEKEQFSVSIFTPITQKFIFQNNSIRSIDGQSRERWSPPPDQWSLYFQSGRCKACRISSVVLNASLSLYSQKRVAGDMRSWSDVQVSLLEIKKSPLENWIRVGWVSIRGRVSCSRIPGCITILCGLYVWAAYVGQPKPPVVKVCLVKQLSQLNVI